MAPKKIAIVAGELSGDFHGSNLVRCLRNENPNYTFFGLGGKNLEKAGVEVIINILDKAVIGFVEAVKAYFVFRKILNDFLAEIDRRHPDLVILIDNPGFNLTLAKEIKKRGIPVIYYISPQIWAWHFDRIHTIKKLIDLMIVFFPFEKKLYDSYQVPCLLTGHPLVDTARADKEQSAILSGLKLDAQKTIISLLPGSRQREVRTLLPCMIKSAVFIHKQLPQTVFLIQKSPNLENSLYQDFLKNAPDYIRLIDNDFHNSLSVSDFALVASGTATLETAIMNVPMVILYKVSALSAILMRLLIRIPYIGLVNVVREKKIIPEFLQQDMIPENVAGEVINQLNDSEKIESVKNELRLVRTSLGEGKAYEKAASGIASFIKNLNTDN